MVFKSEVIDEEQLNPQHEEKDDTVLMTLNVNGSEATAGPTNEDVRSEISDEQNAQLSSEAFVLIERLPTFDQKISRIRVKTANELRSVEVQTCNSGSGSEMPRNERFGTDNTIDVASRMPELKPILMQIYETELNIKIMQQQREHELMQLEREIYGRRLAALDLEIKKKKIEVQKMGNMEATDADMPSLL